MQPAITGMSRVCFREEAEFYAAKVHFTMGIGVVALSRAAQPSSILGGYGSYPRRWGPVVKWNVE